MTEQEIPGEPMMSVRTRAGLLCGWYFPSGQGGYCAERYGSDGTRQACYTIADEPGAVTWIAAGNQPWASAG